MKDIMFLLMVFLFVIGIAYFITKQLASLGTKRMQGKNIKLLETMQIGMNQQIHLMQIGNKLFILGVSKERITYLTEIDDQSIDLSLYKINSQTPSFEYYLKNGLKKEKIVSRCREK